mmetsp:Transcript_42473/g.48805  ORF Transcript_42473/g.48805 Transcript_42473/m.48805 type:complete len:179 (+) Transcript_42473:41-577(+)
MAATLGNTPFNWIEDTLIFDEKRQKIVHSSSLTPAQNNEYKHGHYKSVRPDLTKWNTAIFQQNVSLARSYIGIMGWNNIQEVDRCMNMFSGNHFTECMDLVIHHKHFQYPFHSTLNSRPYDWQDASKMALFLKSKVMRADKYGLLHGHFDQCTEDELKQKEDELVDFFLEEMRKKPEA